MNEAQLAFIENIENDLNYQKIFTVKIAKGSKEDMERLLRLYKNNGQVSYRLEMTRKTPQGMENFTHDIYTLFEDNITDDLEKIHAVLATL